MELTEPQTALLDNAEKELLSTIFYKRRKNLLVAYACLMGIAFACSMRGGDYRGRNGKITKWEEQDDAQFVSRNQMRLINALWLELPLLATGIYFWRKRVFPYKRDADSGMKHLSPFTIKDKKYFPLTNQYFLVLDNPIYMHHEVDAEDYNNLNTGDRVFLSQGIHSKYIFQKDGRYQLI